MNTERSSNLKTYLPWAVAAIAVVALGVNLLWDRGAPGGDDAVAQLNERLAALEAGNQGPARRPQPGMSGGPGAAGLGPDDGSLSGMRAAQTPEEAAAERDKQHRELEAQFAADVADPATGPATENTLVQTISGETMAGTGLKPTDVDIACKKSSCRIVGTFDKMGDAQDWSLFYITAAGGNVLSQTRMVFLPKDDGKTEVRIYSTRAKG